MNAKDIKIFCDKLDPKVRMQISDYVTRPFIKRAAIMPDAHYGDGISVGTVMEADDYIIPSVIGYDIGCGVLAVKVDVAVDELHFNEEAIWKKIEEKVPIKQGHPVNFGLADSLTKLGNAAFQERGGYRQLGTLGGGNHFIEIAYSPLDESVWIIVHTGSRGFGHGLATAHLSRMKYPMSLGSQYGKEYMNDYHIAVKYANTNRVLIARRVLEALSSALDLEVKADWDTIHHKLHNFAEKVGDMVLHRKGAISAKKGERVIVPGNMRDGTFLGVGLGNDLALNSAAHGAGRVLSRSQAKKKLNIKDMEDDMEYSGVYCGTITKRALAESPEAYKDIELVMEQQMGVLMKVTNKLVPLISYKGV